MNQANAQQKTGVGRPGHSQNQQSNVSTSQRLALTFSSPEAVSWAITALLQGRAISTQNQIDEVGGWRLGAIIWALRQPPFNWKIDMHKIGAENIAHYVLAPGTVVSELVMPAGFEHLTKLGGAKAEPRTRIKGGEHEHL